MHVNRMLVHMNVQLSSPSATTVYVVFLLGFPKAFSWIRGFYAVCTEVSIAATGGSCGRRSL